MREALNLAPDLDVDVLNVESDSQLLIRYFVEDIRPISSLVTGLKYIDFLFLFF